MRPRRLLLVSLAAAALSGVATGSAAASSIVYVCGQDLCRVDEMGAGRKRLTSDGAAAAGAYSRPSLSIGGEKIAFKRGDPGRVFTAELTPTGLANVTRIEPSPDGSSDATQYDVAIAPNGARVAWVEHRISGSLGTISYRPYTANVDGSDHQRPSDSTSRPFVGWFGDDALVRNGLAGEFRDRDAERVDQGLCMTTSACAAGDARQIAFDPAGRSLRKPAISPDRGLLVATASTADGSTAVDLAGALVLFDTATAAPVRELTTGPDDSYATFSPAGGIVAFTRGGAIWTVPVAGGRPKRLVASGVQPAWGAVSFARLAHASRVSRRALGRGLVLRVAGLPSRATVAASARGPRGVTARARKQTRGPSARLTLRFSSAELRRLRRGRPVLRLTVRVTSPTQRAQQLGGRVKVTGP
jgi:hypothetical protein